MATPQQQKKYIDAGVAQRYWDTEPIYNEEALTDLSTAIRAGEDQAFLDEATLHVAVRQLADINVLCLIVHPEELPELSLDEFNRLDGYYGVAIARPSEANTPEAKALRDLLTYRRWKNNRAMLSITPK